MFKRLAIALLSLVSIGQLALALPVHAQTGQDDPLKLLQDTGVGQGSPADAGTRLPQLVGRIIRVLIGLLGVIFLVLIVYAGFIWMLARGDSGEVDRAKDIIKSSIIGLIIVFIAYTLTGFIINAILKATTGP